MVVAKAVGADEELTAALRHSLREGLERERATKLSLYRHDLKIGQAAADEGSEDIVDRANRAYDQELVLALSDAERSAVIEIEGALARLEKGSYGACDHCDKPIGVARLKAVPWARYCIVCQERDENGELDD